MKRLLLLSLLTLALAACADKNADTSSSVDSDVTARTDARRARIARLSNVNAVARLYVGHELTRDELHGLLTKNEAAVLDAMIAHPDFKTRFAGRLAEFNKETGLRSTGAQNASLDPSGPLADVFGGKKDQAERFAKWLTRSLAPIVAEEIFATSTAQLGEMTYRDLLETVRKASVKAVRP